MSLPEQDNARNAPSSPPAEDTVSLLRKFKITKGRLRPKEIRSSLIKVMTSDTVKRKCKLGIIPDDEYLDRLTDKITARLEAMADQFNVTSILKKDKGGTLSTLYNTDAVLLAYAIRETLLDHFRLAENDLSPRLIKSILGIEDSPDLEKKQLPQVLVVEDDERISKILEMLLRKEGFDPVVASDGEEALAKIAANSIKLAVIDINLPKKNGLEVLGLLRMSKNFKHIPVIMASANHDVNIVRTCLQAGARDFILKPYKGNVVVEKIKKHLLK